MFECPNCKEKTISKSTKFFLGPGRAKTCSCCGAKVSIPYLSLFGLNVFLLLMALLLIKSPNMAVAFTGIIIIAILWSYLFYRFVPLVVKPKVKNARYHIKNISIMVLYFVSVMFIYINMVSPSVYFFRQDLVEDLVQVQTILEDLESKLDEGQDLSTHLFDARKELMAISYDKQGYYKLFMYVKLWPVFEQINRLSEQVSNQDEIRNLKAMINLGKTYSDIRDVSIYTYSFGLDARWTVPDTLLEYEYELKQLLDDK